MKVNIRVMNAISVIIITVFLVTVVYQIIKQYF